MYINESNLQFKSNMAYGNKPNSIIEHHAESKQCSIQDVHQWHLENGWAGCGYHFLVRKNGDIYRGRPEDAIGSHCPGMNSHSIGICAEGDYMTETMPAVQKQSLIDLGIYIKNKYGIKNVYGHEECYETSCPGTNYPLQDIKTSIINGQDSTVKPSDAIKALQYDLNLDYNAKLVVTGIDNASTEATLKGIQNIIVKGHKSHVVLWVQQKLIGYGYLKKGQDTSVYDEATFQAVANMQKNWGRPTDGILRIETWNIFLNN